MRPSTRTWALTTQRPPQLWPQVLVTTVSPGSGSDARRFVDHAVRNGGLSSTVIPGRRARGSPQPMNTDRPMQLQRLSRLGNRRCPGFRLGPSGRPGMTNWVYSPVILIRPPGIGSGRGAS